MHTRIICLSIIIVVANACAFTQDVGTPAAPAPRILIELPDNVPSDAVWIRYFLSGPRSSGAIVKREPNLRRYVIDARIGVEPAQHAKIVVYAPGCQFKAYTIDLDGASDASEHFQCERNQLRKLGHRNQRRVCSRPSHEAEVRVLARRIAVGSGRRNHSARMEAALSGDGGRLGFSQPANSEALRFWLAAEEGAQGGGARSKDSGTDRLAYVSSQLSRLARRNGCSPRRTAETDVI